MSKQRGGFRPGAGRHPVKPHLKKKQFRFYIEQQYIDEIEARDGTDDIIAYIKRKFKPKIRRL